VPVECAILVGLPGAGKTTFYRAHLQGTHVHVSKDLFKHATNRQQRMLRDIGAALAQGRSVAVDNTNPSRADRASIIELARARGARVIAYHVRATTREAVSRNEGRAGGDRVPKVAIFTAAKRLEPPAADEGFDAVFDVLPKAALAFEVTGAPSPGTAPVAPR
jgi:predicted kinase